MTPLVCMFAIIHQGTIIGACVIKRMDEIPLPYYPLQITFHFKTKCQDYKKNRC